MNGDRGRWTKGDRKGQRDIERERKRKIQRGVEIGEGCRTIINTLSKKNSITQ